MNPIMKFYAAVLAYLQSNVEMEGAISAILKLAKKTLPSWQATEESLKSLEQIINRSSELTDKEYDESEIQEDFVTAAFKDLSVLKNPAAMGLFVKIREYVALDGDSFIWARSIKERLDGSAVVILHVSDLKKFTYIIENCDMANAGAVGGRSLTDCVFIGS